MIVLGCSDILLSVLRYLKSPLQRKRRKRKRQNLDLCSYCNYFNSFLHCVFLQGCVYVSESVVVTTASRNPSPVECHTSNMLEEYQLTESLRFSLAGLMSVVCSRLCTPFSTRVWLLSGLLAISPDSAVPGRDADVPGRDSDDLGR